jgi:mannose-6-phosphate isomerase-like protein (cupin superfamily)
MTAVIGPDQGRLLTLPGRTASELISAAAGGYDVTFRRVVIPPGGPDRSQHVHPDCTEIMLVMAGDGEFASGDEIWPARTGDVIVVSPGQPHRTRNTGSGDLVLCCFFPVPVLTTIEGPLPDTADGAR